MKERALAIQCPAGQAVEIHDYAIEFVNVELGFDRFRADPRYKILLKKIGLAD